MTSEEVEKLGAEELRWDRMLSAARDAIAGAPRIYIRTSRKSTYLH